MKLVFADRHEYYRDNVFVKIDDNLDDVLKKVHAQIYSHLAVVVDDEWKFIGIITPEDIRKALAHSTGRDRKLMRVAEFYNRAPSTIDISELNKHKENNTSPFDGRVQKKLIVLDGSRFHSTISFETSYCNIDIIDVCNLHCATCPRGRGEIRNTKGKMDLELFERIIQKACKNSYRVRLFNWTEPFLCDDLENYLEIVDRYGLIADLSTNLSMQSIANLKDVLYTGKGDIVISVSGFYNEVHQVNHRGSDIEIVKNHIRFISECYVEKSFNRKVSVKFLAFNYNTHEIALFKEWCEAMIGIKFIVYPARGNPESVPNNYTSRAQDKTRQDKTRQDKTRQDKDCDVMLNETVCGMFRDINIDNNGDTYLCCRYPNLASLKIGHFLDNTIDDILINRLLHPLCIKCGEALRTFDMPLTIKNRLFSTVSINGAASNS